MKHQSSQRVRLRLVVVELDAEFSDDEPASLSGIPVDGEEVTDVRPKPVCKTGQRFPFYRKVGGE